MSTGQKRLGRGLSSLIASELSPTATSTQDPPKNLPEASILDRVRAVSPHGRLMSIPVDQIRRNPSQPRRAFDDTKLAALAASLKARGVLQPIVVRPADAGYELVAGERRLRAAKLAGVSELPAIVRAAKDDELLELALIENVQRADLNPVERARAYRVLHERHGLPHEEIGKRMGEDRATVSNYLRILSLHDSVLALVATESLGIGHAKVLLGVSDTHSQILLAERVVAEDWSVRQLEGAVAALKKGEKPAPKVKMARPAVQDLEERLSTAIGTRVQIKEGRKRHAGRLVIDYYSLDDFQRIVARLGLVEEDDL